LENQPGSERRLRHASFVYRTPGEFLTAIQGFAQAGINADEPTCVAATRPNVDLLREQLPELGRHVTYADMSVVGLNPGRILSGMHLFAEQHPGAALRYVQEPLWPAQSAEQQNEAIRHEALLNLALTSYTMMVLCPYDFRLVAQTLASADRTHPDLASGGSWQHNLGYADDPVIPAEFDLPLQPAPASAAVMTYRRNLGAPRRFTLETARQLGLAQARAVDLVIAVAELTANTWRYTTSSGTVAIWRDRSEVICQVSDTGHITNPLAGRRRPQTTAPDGGRGLWLVHQLCDLVETRSRPDGTTIRLRMEVDDAPLRRLNPSSTG
jgi:anti-sigma regulatory factor (Ser/Thr protein kinase)